MQGTVLITVITFPTSSGKTVNLDLPSKFQLSDLKSVVKQNLYPTVDAGTIVLYRQRTEHDSISLDDVSVDDLSRVKGLELLDDDGARLGDLACERVSAAEEKLAGEVRLHLTVLAVSSRGEGAGTSVTQQEARASAPPAQEQPPPYTILAEEVPAQTAGNEAEDTVTVVTVDAPAARHEQGGQSKASGLSPRIIHSGFRRMTRRKVYFLAIGICLAICIVLVVSIMIPVLLTRKRSAQDSNDTGDISPNQPNVPPGTFVRNFTGLDGPTYNFVLSPDDKYMYVSGLNSTSQFDITTGNLVRQYVLTDDPVKDVQPYGGLALSISSGGGALFTCGRHCYRWNTATGERVATFLNLDPAEKIDAVKNTNTTLWGWSRRDGSARYVLRIWTISTQNIQANITGVYQFFDPLLSSNALWMFTEAYDTGSSDSKIVEQWTTTFPQQNIQNFTINKSTDRNHKDMELSHDNRYLFVATQVGTVLKWDTTTGALKRFVVERKIESIAISPDDKWLYLLEVKNADSAISRMNVETGETVFLFNAPNTGADAFSSMRMKLSKDGKFMFIPAEEKRATISQWTL